MALDIIFLSYDEPNADQNFEILKQRFSYAKRVHGIQGIANAHLAAAQAADTRMFYVVDGDTVPNKDFDFSFEPPSYDRDFVHIWKSMNPINHLEYGYGGIKLFSKKFFRNIEANSVDFSTSLTKDVKYVDETIATTYFNSDPFRTWRGAYRECAKLASKTIDGQIDEETEKRLNIWNTVADKNAYYGEYALDGAKMGSHFGYQNQGNKEALKKVNDFNWLKDLFEQTYHGKY